MQIIRALQCKTINKIKFYLIESNTRGWAMNQYKYSLLVIPKFSLLKNTYNMRKNTTDTRKQSREIVPC